MSMFSQSLIQGLINPSYADKLGTAGMLAGSMPDRLRLEREERAKEEAEKMQAIQRQQAQLQTYLAASRGKSDPGALAAAAEIPGTDIGALIDAKTAGSDVAAQERERKKEELANSSQAAFMASLGDQLRANGQASFASVVANIPNLEMLPAAAQERILAAAGITDPEEQQKAQSREGKLAADMGFVLGTPDFRNKVEELATASTGVNPDAFQAINAAVKSNVDLKRNSLLNNAVVASSSTGSAGSESLQENTILELFGNVSKAQDAVRRFASSTSLGRNIWDGAVKVVTGNKSQATKEERDAILYAAIKIQEEALESTVNSAAAAMNVAPEDAVNIRKVYFLPESTKEWARRFEEKNFKPKESTGNNRIRYDAQGNRI
jgi:hypothetical protein